MSGCFSGYRDKNNSLKVRNLMRQFEYVCIVGHRSEIRIDGLFVRSETPITEYGSSKARHVFLEDDRKAMAFQSLEHQSREQRAVWSVIAWPYWLQSESALTVWMWVCQISARAHTLGFVQTKVSIVEIF